jgi:3-hydroxypropanoate dehydrogenase
MPDYDVPHALLAEHIALDEAGQALLFTEARSANTFSDEPVTSDQLHAIWELAKFPPTAANTNPLRVLFVSSPDARARLVEHMSDGNKAKTASAPAVAILAADLDFHEYIPQLFPPRPELRDYFAADDAARAAHARFNATLQIGYFLLAVRAAGLAAGPMAGFDAAGVDAEFFPDGRLSALLVVNIGTPGENPWFDRLPRLDYEQAVRFV